MPDANIRAVITAEDRASATLGKFGDKVDSVGNAALTLGKRIIQAGAAATVAFTTLGVKTAADLESARMGFVTLLGSAEKADKTLQRIKEEAKRTPFEMTGLTKATQMLAAVTKDGDKAIDIILDVGEGLAAMGRGQEELDRVSVNLQQIAASGRAAMIDIRQFAFAGIPIFEMLKEETGLAGEALDDFIANGGVTFDLLTQMFDKANDEGGRFFEAFKNQTGTFNQQWSNLKDTFAITAAEIVKSTGLFDLLKNAMAGISTWVTTNKPVIEGFVSSLQVGATVVTTFKDQFAILLAVVAGYTVINAAATAVERLNGALNASPLGLIAAGISGVLVWFSLMKMAVDRATASVDGLRNSIANATANILGNIPLIGSTIERWFRTAIEWTNRLAEAINGIVDKIPVLNKVLPDIRTINLQQRAKGGPVSANSPYIVGEKGPELFVPSKSGEIVANKDMGTQATPTPMIVNVSFSGVFTSDEAEMRRLAEKVFQAKADLASKVGMSLTESVARA